MFRTSRGCERVGGGARSGGREGGARRPLADAHTRGRVPSLSANRRACQGRGISEEDLRRRRRPCEGGAGARGARDPRAAGRCPAGRSRYQTEHGRDQPGARRSRSRAVGPPGRAPRRRAAVRRHQRTAESRRAAGHRRRDSARSWGGGAGGDREGCGRGGRAAIGGVEGYREQDAYAARVHAHHGAVRRRDHPPLCGHRRDDSGRHLFADPDDAGRAAVGKRPAAADYPGARVGGLAHPARRAGRGSR